MVDWSAIQFGVACSNTIFWGINFQGIVGPRCSDFFSKLLVSTVFCGLGKFDDQSPNCASYVNCNKCLISGERLSGAIVRVGDDRDVSKNPVCGIVTNSSITDSTDGIEVSCGDHGLNGLYLSIHLPTQEYMQLCEVKAYVGSLCEG